MTDTYLCKNTDFPHVKGVNEGDCKECDRYMEQVTKG